MGRASRRELRDDFGLPGEENGDGAGSATEHSSTTLAAGLRLGRPAGPTEAGLSNPMWMVTESSRNIGFEGAKVGYTTGRRGVVFRIVNTDP